VQVRIDGKGHFISRLGRWDNPAALAKAQALSTKIWGDFQSSTFESSLRIYRELSQGQDAALVERMKVNAGTHRQERAIHAYRMVERYGKALRSLTNTQEFIRWAQEDQNLSNRTDVGILCELKRPKQRASICSSRT